jgi:hypothetical protein
MKPYETAYYKGRAIRKRGNGVVIMPHTRNSSSRQYPNLEAATNAIDHDRRIKVTVPFTVL